jgi:hypothetical protein
MSFSEGLRGTVRSIGGIEDHVHLLVSLDANRDQGFPAQVTPVETGRTLNPEKNPSG